jgi:chromate transport protein ChrA
MEGFVAILICVIAAIGGIVTAASLSHTRQLATTRRARSTLFVAVVFFSLFGGIAIVPALVLVTAWIVTWL